MSAATLETEVADLISRRNAAGKPVVPSEPSTASVASVASEVCDRMRRLRDDWLAFCEAQRPLIAAAPQTISCEHHPLAVRPILFEETCQRTRWDARFTPVYAPCPDCATDKAKAAQRRFWARRGVPERVITATLENFAADTEEKVIALGKVRQWIKDNGVFLLLMGTVGTGKSHLAAGCLKAQGNGRFITHADMLSDLRASYTLHNTDALIDGWRDAEMLVLDEFGLSPGGKDEEPMLYQVLAERHDKHRPTIITSNMSRDAMRDALGYRLIDRINEDCVTVTCNWPSHRISK